MTADHIVKTVEAGKRTLLESTRSPPRHVVRKPRACYTLRMDSSEFEPSVLRWAREARFGPSIKALQAAWAESWDEFSPNDVEEWEKGVGQPTFSQVRKLADIYKRPLAVFFLSSPPDEKRNPPDLRTIGSQDNRLLSPEALLVMRKARRTQEVAADLLSELGEGPAFKYRQYSLQVDASALADEIRQDLAISLGEQFRSKTYEDFFEYLRGKIEGAGVVTLKSGLQDSFPTADCRAFSFADQLPYLIMVNNKDTEGAKTFSLAHEFAHLLVREAGICNNFRSFSERRGVNPVEVFCNQFAANFLVPTKELSLHPSLKGIQAIPPDQIDRTVAQLAGEFKVSRVVILRRLVTLGLVTHALYRAKTAAWSEELPPPRKPGGRFSLSTAIKKNGAAFSSLVVEAYRRRKISYAAASDYLGLKTKHLSRFEKLIDSHATG
ncbi:MAG: ImmA/IrrE family metallo-endopeptidase [Bryobacteraceae bacterium]